MWLVQVSRAWLRSERGAIPEGRGDVQDHRCQPFHTHSVPDLQPRWSGKGSSPRIAIQHTVCPASFPHSSHPFLGWATMEVNTSWRKTACHHHLHQEFPVNLYPSFKILPLWISHGSDCRSWARLIPLKMATGWPLIIWVFYLKAETEIIKKVCCLSSRKCSSTDKLTPCRKAKIRNPWTNYPSNEKLFAVLGHPLLSNKLLLTWVHLFSQPSKCVQLRVCLWWKWK